VSQTFHQVDAFTNEPFRGNPAAVFVLDEPADPVWMQSVALEMNLSETAFCHSSPRTSEEWGLRWFTPTAEMDLCGHATLATAHVLVEEHGAGGEIEFQTKSGRLTAISVDGGIRLDFPVDVVNVLPVSEKMADALGLPIVDAGIGLTDLVLEVGTAADVRGCAPDLQLLARLADRGVVVTAQCDDRDDIDIVSRVFAPNVGIPEDPVTGSAHTTLAAWWAPRLGPVLRAEQASSRGGELDVSLVGERVHLTGCAVTVARGMLLI